MEPQAAVWDAGISPAESSAACRRRDACVPYACGLFVSMVARQPQAGRLRTQLDYVLDEPQAGRLRTISLRTIRRRSVVA